MSEQCCFCMYRDGCIGPLPDGHGRCMAFCVPAELADDYRLFIREQLAHDYIEHLRFLHSLGCSFEDILVNIESSLPPFFEKYFKTVK